MTSPLWSPYPYRTGGHFRAPAVLRFDRRDRREP